MNARVTAISLNAQMCFSACLSWHTPKVKYGTGKTFIYVSSGKPRFVLVPIRFASKAWSRLWKHGTSFINRTGRAWTEMILSYHLLQESIFSPINWYLSRHCFVVGVAFLVGLCLVCVFLCFCFCFWFVCFCLVCFVFGLDDRDSTQDYVSVLHQFTFAATLH